MSTSGEEHENLRPGTPEEVQQCVAAALSRQEPLEVMGGGSKRHYGHPVKAARVLSLAALSGIVDYQPGELIVVVLPGTPLSELEETLAKSGQALAFEPPHWGGAATIGGAVACNLSGPRRIRAGAARDHLLGFKAVTGRGEAMAGGGRVVKNVTGYDMSKLMCGSFGTLAVFTELVLKALPAPETARTVVVPGLSEAEGLALMGEAARSPFEVSGLAHLPPGVRAPAPVAELGAAGDALTLLRLEGPGPSVDQRCEMVSRLAQRQAGYLDQEETRAVWRDIREIAPLALDGGEQGWRVVLPPAAGPRVAAALGEAGALRRFFDWGGSQIWAALPGDASPEAIHALAAEYGGFARLVHPAGPPAEATPLFPPLAAVNHKLHVQLKQAFDPQGVLNPGRMYPDV